MRGRENRRRISRLKIVCGWAVGEEGEILEEMSKQWEEEEERGVNCTYGIWFVEYV